MALSRLSSLSVGKTGTGAQHIVHDLLHTHVKKGKLIVDDYDNTRHTFGDPASAWSARLIVHRERFHDRVLAQRSLGIGEAYMDGDWDAENDDIANVIGLFLANDVGRGIVESVPTLARIALHILRTSPALRLQSARNVAHHYDLGNDFYARMLDASMTYSCGLQLHESDTLEQMQRNKFELMCRKLNLRPGATVIDVGCGWGGFLLYAAKEYGIQGVGITLSPNQLQFARHRAEEEGTAHRVTFRLQDYRDTEGQFDAFVSVGMFEHVGSRQYRIFFRKMQSLLKPGGVGLLHTIGTTGMSGFSPWINRYIFPGGELPKLEQIVRPMRSAGLLVAHIENLKPHYAHTLRHWKRNFRTHWSIIASMGDRFNERFRRMWSFYLQSCEAGFEHGLLQLYQVLTVNDREWTLPPILAFHENPRSYIRGLMHKR